MLKMKGMLPLALAGLIAVPFAATLNAQTAAAGPAGTAAGAETGILAELKLFSKALSAIEQAFVNDVQPRQLLYDAVKGMLAGLGDKFTEFIEPARYELLQMQLKGEYSGIGVMLDLKDGFPVVRSLKQGSAAQKAGVLPQDIFLKIDGKPTQGLDLVAIASQLRGAADTHLVLTIRRDAIGKIFDLEIAREMIEIEAVKDVRMIGKHAGYFWLQSWQEKTADQVDKAIRDLRAQGLQALIIDLRNNDGGLLPSAVAVAERFLGAGKAIVSVSSKIAEQRKDYVSSGKAEVPGLELIVLVNQRSASASEVFSAAVQDHRRASLIGVQTYGKASVQSLVPLDEKSAMKLTTARYKSPAGRFIDHVGLTPDFVVENSPDGQGPDRQVLKAMELFRKYM